MSAPLSSSAAERAMRIIAHARRVLSGKPGYADEWLRTPQSALHEHLPLQALTNEAGARAVVEEILLGLEHGFFA